jgi:predicted dehydrogenase
MTYQRDFQQKLRVGVVGLGGHAYRNVLPALHYLPVELAALCDVDADRLARTEAEYRTGSPFTDAEAMFRQASLDAVLLCTGPRYHPALTMQAFAAGLDVWMEKPPAIRAFQVADLLAARGERVCAVGFKKAYMPAAQKARELLALPAFGALQSMQGVYRVTIPRDGARWLEAGAEPPFLSVGCHPLSLMIACGGPVSHVTTLRGPGEEAAAIVALHFASGAIGNLHLAAGSPELLAAERYDFYGQGQVISIENSTRVAYHRGVPFAYETQLEFATPGLASGSVVWESSNAQGTLENTSFVVQGMVAELSDFCAAVAQRRQPSIGTLEFALQVMQVYEAAMLSQGEARAVGGEVVSRWR